MNNFIEKILYPIDAKDYKRIVLILFFTIISAFFEILGIGLMIPVLNIFAGNDYGNYISYFQFLSEYNKLDILRLILGIFVIIYIIKFLVNRFLIVIQNKFSNQLYANLAKKFFKNYLNKSYSFHTQNNSSLLIRNINHETNLYSFGIVFPTIVMISELIIFFSISTILLIFDFKASLLTIIFFIIVGFSIFKLTNKRLKILGKKRQFHSAKYIKQLQQGFFSFREILINGLQKTLVNKFSYHIFEQSDANRKRDTITQMPRLVLELVGVLAFVTLFLFLLLVGYEISNIFIIVGLFFYAAIRLLPSISKIVVSFQSIRFNTPALNVIFEETKKFEKENFLKIQKKILQSKKSLSDFSEVTFNDVSFSYQNTSNLVLKNLNLKIKKGDKVGIMGKTGSGKSTFINLFCGLLDGISGQINLDQKPLKDFVENWQMKIGYVPQTVSIFDETILFNITLEEDKKKINLEKVNQILKIVDLDHTIDKLPNKLDDFAGEYGSNLSGGQCQRLGIARALYKKPDIIILDEATSGLDENTENLILSKLFRDQLDLTIITISHRKNSLKHCNKFFKIENSEMSEFKKL